MHKFLGGFVVKEVVLFMSYNKNLSRDFEVFGMFFEVILLL
jgi:hypothetical protein